jgi:hypothetical protein
MRVRLPLLCAVASLAATALSTALSTPAASAVPGAIEFQAAVRIDCFGCGDSIGSASLCTVFVSTPSGASVCAGAMTEFVSVTAGPASEATFTVHEGTGIDCVISGTAEGDVFGAVNVTFTWTRVGAFALISTSGEINGSGVALFVITGPAGLPCGATNLTATVSGLVYAV